MTLGEQIGVVTHYYNHIHVAVIHLERDLALGDLVYFSGAHTDFGQEVHSMQIDHRLVTHVAAGREVAVQVRRRVRQGDAVYRVEALDEAAMALDEVKEMGE